MDPATALIALGALLVAVPFALWLRGRGGDPLPLPLPPRPPPPPSELPVLRVVALGLDGAGKTVLLASQFHTLSVPAGDRRFFLDVEWEQQNYLAGLFTSVSDTSAPWPSATRIGNLQEFVFSCTAHDLADVERTLFRISYLDYAGELLESEPLDESHDALRDVMGKQSPVRELKAKVRGAQALLLVLDGRRMLQLLRGEDAGRDYFEWRLAPLLAVARRAKCPVQLILTKWDLVRTFDDSDEEQLLRKVKDELLSNRRVELVVQAHRARNERVRLIPVSAVGPRFADLNANGTVVKRPDGRIEPVHVDVPLCAVLPDVLKHLEREHAAAVRAEIEREMRRHGHANAAAIAISVLESAAGKMVQKAVSGLVGGQIVKLFVELLVREKLPETSAPAGAEQAQPLEPDEEEIRRLRAEVVSDMREIAGRLERDFGSSILR